MSILHTLLIFACGQPLSAQVPLVLPELRIPPGTLLFREHISSRGTERTGNWWARISTDGCYTEAHNTWMWVSDPVLRASSAWTLHWNGSPRPDPWFCLNGPQLRRLRQAARRVEAWGGASDAPGPIDRWTVRIDGYETSIVLPVGAHPAGFEPLLTALTEIAEQGVWGLSPESPEDSSSHATAMLP